MYPEDRAYRQGRAYPEGGMHRDDQPYQDDELYRSDNRYRDDAASPPDGQYGQGSAHELNDQYQGGSAYPRNGQYSDDGFWDNGQYEQDRSHGQADRYGQGSQYGDNTARMPRDTRGADTDYLKDIAYRQEAAYQRNGRHQQDGLYQRDGVYQPDAGYPHDAGYPQDGRYPTDGLYRDRRSYPSDGEYADEGPYPHDGAGGKDGMYRQAEADVPTRGVGGRGRRARRRRGPRSRRTKLILRVAAAIVAVFLLITGWSLGHALTIPGGGTFSERVAEWARTHYLSPLVTFGEWLTYKAPVKGGKPDVNLNHLGGKTVTKKKYHHGIVPIIPDRMASPAGKPLPGEGVWKAVVSVKGVPAVFKTYVRESKTYSSYYAGVVSMDPRLLRFSLRPGTEDPGYGHWGFPMDIPPGHRRGLVATFNSGFRVYAAGGGIYMNHRYGGKLVHGAASEVYFTNGTMTVGSWGHGKLHMGPDIAQVRQNLKLIVINGQVPKSVDYNVEASWGATLGGGYYVWRSGVGVTKDGRIIFAYGPALNVRDLAALLKRAGCVTAMELDINPDWMSFMYYLAKHHPNNPIPINLLKNQVQPPARYYSLSNRDFTAVFAR